MADLTRTVAIIFEGDDRVTKALNSISKGFTQFDQTITAVAEPLAKVADTILAVDAALAGLTIGGLALSIKASGEFGDSFAEISTIAGATGKDIDIFRKDILKYAQDSLKSIEDINGAIYTAISAGVDYKESLDFLRESEKLAIAGRADLESTTRFLASTLNAYGESTDQAAHYSEIFFKTVKLGQTTIPEMADSMADLTQISGTSRIPIEEVTAALAALTAGGAPTTKAITQIRGILNALIKPSSQAQELANQLGIEFSLQAVKAKGLQTVLWEVYRATGGNEEQMGKLFGRVEGLTGAMALGKDISGKYRDALKQMREETRLVEKAYAEMADEFTNINQRLANNIKVVLIDLGDKIKIAYSDVVSGVTVLFQAIDKAIDQGAFDRLLELFNDFGQRLKDLLERIAEIAPEVLMDIDWSGVIKAIQELGEEIGTLFEGFDPTDPEQLKNAIQGIIDTIESLIITTKGMIQYFEPLWDALKESIKRFNEMDNQAKESFGKVLGAAELVVHAGVLIAAALVTIKETGASIANVFNALVGSIRVVFNTFQWVFSATATAILQVVEWLARAAELATRHLPGLKGINEELKVAIGEIEGLKEGALADSVAQYRDVLDSAAQAWRGITGETKEAQDEAGKYKKAIDEIPEKITTEIHPLMDLSGLKDVETQIEKIPPKKDTIIMTKIDGTQEELTLGRINVISSPRTVPIKTEVEPDSMKKAELEYDLLIARLQEKTKILQAAYEYKARVDIAEIEAGTEQIKAAFESVNVGIQDTGDLMGSLFGQLTKQGLSFQQAWAVEDQIRQENRRRDEILKLQREMTEAQINLMEARKEALERGDSIITIQSDGLEPYLEAFMWAILEKIQIRANAEQEEFLLGVA